MDDLRRNGSGYYDPTAYKALMNVQKGNNMVVSRGDIYYVCSGNRDATGSEQKTDRPAVIVSNNKGNEFSQIVEVVYLTGEEKKRYLPTHVQIMCKIPSTALCEQIASVSKSRLTEYVRTCSAAEMEKIDRALMVSLGIGKEPDPAATVDNSVIDDLKMKLEGTERELDEVKAEREKCEAKLREIETHLEKQAKAEKNDHRETVVLEMQRDMYKQQYYELLERLVAR
jgi:mRNA interferase MazF